jgi:hypothetical protein
VRVNGFVNRSPNQPPGRAAWIASSWPWRVHPGARKVARQQQAQAADGEQTRSSQGKVPVVCGAATGARSGRTSEVAPAACGCRTAAAGRKTGFGPETGRPFPRSDDQPSPPRCSGDCAVPGRQASRHGLILARWRDLGYPAARPGSAPTARNPSGALPQRGWRRPASALARPHHQRPSQPLIFDMEVILRRQDHPSCASITCMIRHYVARRAQVIEDHHIMPLSGLQWHQLAGEVTEEVIQ